MRREDEVRSFDNRSTATTRHLSRIGPTPNIMEQ